MSHTKHVLPHFALSNSIYSLHICTVYVATMISIFGMHLTYQWLIIWCQYYFQLVTNFLCGGQCLLNIAVG